MKIVTDCAADMPVGELEKLGVTQAPLVVQFPEGAVNSTDLDPDEFYRRLEAMRPAIPTTSQPSSGAFGQIYQTLSKTDDQIFSLHISSGLSGTLNAARVGSQMVEGKAQVTAWDTLTLSGAQRFQVVAAALAARAGWMAEAIQQRLTQIRTQAEIFYTLDTLEYLARGGRIGRVQALAGSLLGLKPIISVDHRDGKYNTLGKTRTLTQAMKTISDQLHATYTQTPLWVTILHGRFAPKAEALAEELAARLNVVRMETLRIAPVLGVHTGPGVVGAAAVPMSLVEDLM